MLPILFCRIALIAAALLLCGFTEPKTVMFEAYNSVTSAGAIAKIDGYLSKPEGAGPFPAVVILHTCGGARRNLSHVWPAFYVKHGYVALTVDSFGSRNVGNGPNEFTQLPDLAPYKAVAADAHSALRYLADQPFVKKGHVAVVGHSFGGIAIHMVILPAYAAAKPSRSFRAAISLYGPCVVKGGTVAMPNLARSPIPLLEIIGEKDERILLPCKAHLPRHASTELHVLPDAYHAFDIEWFTTMRHGHRGAKMLYSETATKTARGLIRDFLATNSRELR
jgi:dienelactone hydrolase